MLTKGDITKRDEILWGYTIDECKPYLDHCVREVKFQESVLAFFRIYYGLSQDDKPGATKREQSLGEYCKGADVAECEAYFGKGVLKRVCETCPN